MRKILLTEAQVRIIEAEIQKNDKIQKLLFTDPTGIKFTVQDDVIPDGIPVSRGYCHLIPVIGNTEIGRNYVCLSAEEIKTKKGFSMYQLHIEVSPEYRNQGIAEKLYTAFILQGYPTCSLYSNRAANFYKQNKSGVPSDVAIEKLWNRIAANPEIVVKPLMRNKEQIGVFAIKKTIANRENKQ